MPDNTAGTKYYRIQLLKWSALCAVLQCVLIYVFFFWSLRHGLQLFTPVEPDWYDGPVLLLILATGPAIYSFGAYRICKRPDVRSAGLSRTRLFWMAAAWLILGDVAAGIALFLGSISLLTWADSFFM